jgi:hypothetical protein
LVSEELAEPAPESPPVRVSLGLPDVVSEARRSSLPLPAEPWYYACCRGTTALLLILALIAEGWIALGLLRQLARASETAAEGSHATTAILLALGWDALSALATVAGATLVLVLVDGASQARKTAWHTISR